MSQPNYIKREYENDMTGLMIAVNLDDYDAVVYQIEILKVNPNHQRKNGRTALMYAISKNNLKIVTYLCENGANKDLQDEIENTAIMHAIYMCRTDIAMYLIMNGANINIKNELDEYPIHFASMMGNLLIIKMLYERGCKLNVYNNNHHTPLMMACGHKHLNCVKYLVQNGADINAEDNNNDNLLHGCIHNDVYDILLFLVTNKNNKIINNRNCNNMTPLSYAIKQNKMKYAELLLKYGADTHTCNLDGYTPLLYTTERNDFEGTKMLLKYGANPNTYFTWNGYASPLFNAFKNKNDELVKLLLDHGANDMMYIFILVDDYDNFNKLLNENNLNMKNSNGATLLFFAADRNKLNFVKILLENGANPNISNKLEQNRSPLYQAMMNNNYDMFILLIKYKADYNHQLNNYESIRGRASRWCWTSGIYDELIKLNAIELNEWDQVFL
jgi:ankyrin repeat protein